MTMLSKTKVILTFIICSVWLTTLVARKHGGSSLRKHIIHQFHHHHQHHRFKSGINHFEDPKLEQIHRHVLQEKQFWKRYKKSMRVFIDEPLANIEEPTVMPLINLDPYSEWAKSHVGNCNSSLHYNKRTFCRVSGKCLPEPLYELNTCALCYGYMPPRLFRDKLKPAVKEILFDDQVYSISMLTNGSSMIEADPWNPDEAIVQSFIGGQKRWEDCCKAAVQCCDIMKSDLRLGEEHNMFCPRTWDGWQCWKDTKAGGITKEKCPPYIFFFSHPPECERTVKKQCMETGHWFQNERNVEWSNYSSCSNVPYFHFHVYFKLSTHAISAFSLVPALYIFYSYKQLRVARVVMHKNMFISLLFSSICVLVFQGYVMLKEQEQGWIQQNLNHCIVLLLLTKLCRLTNYMWMFCEALFLHNLVSSAFAQQRHLCIYYFIGWVFPLMPVSLYAWLRYNHANEWCWVVPTEPYEWILNVPCLLALLVNTFFMVNIIRVLLTKLRAANTREPCQYRSSLIRKAVRATLVLVPLFGLHFLITIYRPEFVACGWINVYHYLNSGIDGLQGLVVSLVFCYCNGEIRNLVNRSYNRWTDIQEARRRSLRQLQAMANFRTSSQHNTIVSLFENIRPLDGQDIIKNPTEMEDHGTPVDMMKQTETDSFKHNSCATIKRSTVSVRTEVKRQLFSNGHLLRRSSSECRMPLTRS